MVEVDYDIGNVLFEKLIIEMGDQWMVEKWYCRFGKMVGYWMYLGVIIGGKEYGSY